MIAEKVLTYLKCSAEFRDYIPENADENFPLTESGVIDSLGLLSLVDFLEETFQIKIQAADLVEDHFSSAKTIEKFVLSQKEQPYEASI